MSVLASPALTAENAYDILDRVTNITYRAADRALVRAFSYAYDPLGRRISTTDGSGTAFHVYDGDECTADMDAAGTPLRSYTWGPGIDNLLAITVYAYQSNSLQPTASSYFVVKDHLGSVHALVDATGAVVESYTYDAWGIISVLTSNLRPPTSNFSLRYLFQGREYSFATGLYNFRARWYDPQLGRWLSNDPIGISGGLNLYEFCGNDPVNYVDPEGLFRFGKRPLTGAPWIPGFSSSMIDNLLNTEFSHEHAFFEDGSGENIGFGENGRFNECPDGRGYRYDDTHYDDDLMRKALENVKDGQYNFIGFGKGPKNNCQDWCSRLRKEYKRLKKSQTYQ